MLMPEVVTNLPDGRRRDLDRRTRIDWDDLAGQFADLAHERLRVLAADEVHHLDLAAEGFNLIRRHVPQDGVFARRADQVPPRGGASHRVIVYWSRMEGLHADLNDDSLRVSSALEVLTERGLLTDEEMDQVMARLQLGGSGAYADPVPERPKGMHHRTYERLCNEAEKAELPYQWRVMTRLQGLLEKSGLLPPRGARKTGPGKQRNRAHRPESEVHHWSSRSF